MPHWSHDPVKLARAVKRRAKTKRMRHKKTRAERVIARAVTRDVKSDATILRSLIKRLIIRRDALTLAISALQWEARRGNDAD